MTQQLGQHVSVDIRTVNKIAVGFDGKPCKLFLFMRHNPRPDH
jgi:hypothetical protein